MVKGSQEEVLAKILAEIQEIKECQQAHLGLYEDLFNRTKKIEEDQIAVNKETLKMKEENRIIKNDHRQYVVKQNELEQRKLSNSIELVGLRTKNQDIHSEVKKLLTSVDREIGESFKSCIIEAHHRNSTPIVTVEFVDEKYKAKLILKQNQSRKSGIKILGNEVYAREKLTDYNRKLQWLSKNVMKSTKFKYTWVQNGTVLMRKNEGTPIIAIKHESNIPT